VTEEPIPAAAPEVVRARPERLRRICAVAAVVVLVVFGVGAGLLRAYSTGASFGRDDQVALVGIGVLIALGVLLLGRSSLEADARGLRVRNVLGSHDVRWDVVRAVVFRDGSPWASLDLVDDETLALMAVQAADGERAVQVITALRRLHARYGPDGNVGLGT
jgi:Bacterial PH domain